MQVASQLQLPRSHGESQESSQLTSLPSSSSVASGEVEHEARAPRAKATYSRKSTAVDPAQESSALTSLHATSSSLPTSPTDSYFDSPARSNGRAAQNGRRDNEGDNEGAVDEDDAGELTVSTDVSPSKPSSQNINKAMYGKASHERHVGSRLPRILLSDDDDDTPAPRSKKFRFGLSKSIYHSDAESDPETDDTAKNSLQTGSDPFTGSLSSVQESMSQTVPSIPDLGDDDEQDRTEIVAPPRRGGKISAMRGKNGQLRRSQFASDDDEHNDDEEEPVVTSSRKDRTFKLMSSSGSAPDVDDGRTPSRRDKMEALAAKARFQKHVEQDTAVLDPLVDEFFGSDAPQSASRSALHVTQDIDVDDYDDAMPTFRDGKKVGAKSTTTKKAKRTSPDILDRSAGQTESAKAKQSKAKAPVRPKLKPPTKKDQDTMHRETARLDREHRAKLASAPKKTINLQELLQRITKADSSTVSSNLGAEDGSLPSDPPSSLIPSAHSRSQHLSDPIESDPIKELSSPQPSSSHHASSPVVAMTKQQERRSGYHNNPQKQSSEARIVEVVDDGSDSELPDISAILVASRLKKENEEAFAAYQAKKRKLLQQAEHKKFEQEQEDDLDVYKPGSRLPTTPSVKRQADKMYQSLGFKTTPGPKTYRGTNAAGSPNAASTGSPGKAQDYDDDFVVTDGQLRENGKMFALAPAAIASQTRPRETHAVSDDSQPVSKPTRAQKSGPTQMTQAQFDASIMQKVRFQNHQVRTQKEAKARMSGLAKRSLQLEDDFEQTDSSDLAAMLDRLNAQRASRQDQNDGEVENSDDGNDSDFHLPDNNDTASIVDSDVEMPEMGSASEVEPSADEDDNADYIRSSDNELSELQGQEDEAEDSEKENAPPPSSQQSRTMMTLSPVPGLSHPTGRSLMDDDEDETPQPRVHARRNRINAVVDDDEADLHSSPITSVDSGNVLQPGRFQRSHSNQSQSQDRVPLGDISSQSIGHIASFSRSNTSSPVALHSVPPANATRQDRLLFSGQDEVESFCTDDVPSDAGNGLSQFFAPTMPPPSLKPTASNHQVKSYWDQTQTQSQSQQTTQTRDFKRDNSANSALGAFFNATQQDSLGAESLDVFENRNVAGGKAIGFTQLYDDGTPSVEADEDRPTAKMGTIWDASSMPPPKSTDVDAFAALRRAQMGAALEPLAPTPSALPDLDESQAEREAYALASAEAHRTDPASPGKMYLNNEGFFTQTKPVGSQLQWTQFDSQSQSQTQNRALSGMMQSPVSLLRDSRNPFATSSVASPSLGHAAIPGSYKAAHDFADDIQSADEDDILPIQRKLKRLRRGAVESEPESDDPVESDDRMEEEEDMPPSSQNSARPRNAFDVLQARPAFGLDHEAKPKNRKSAFIEGEAEESDDEELDGNRGAGGLQGVFANEEVNSAGSGDEDDSDDADAEDMAELVDNEKDIDEAEKDRQVHARYLEDQAAQDKRDLELHQRAIQGGLRNSRRGRAGLSGLDDILDDEADDEELRRRAMMAPGVPAWKKRKIEGDEDGMDALAKNAESLPFVQEYENTHNVVPELDAYDFLDMPVDAEDDDGSESSEGEDNDMVDANAEADDDNDGNEEDDVFGPNKPSVAKITTDQVRSAIRDRRRARKQGMISDDEDDQVGDAQTLGLRRSGNDWNSDDDDADRFVAMVLRDRTKGANNTGPSANNPPSNTAGRAKKAHIGMQYGRKDTNKVRDRHEMQDQNAGENIYLADETDNNEDDEEESGQLFDLLSKKGACKPVRSQMGQPNELLDEAEPEWGNDSNIIRAPRPSTTSSKSTTNLSSSTRSAVHAKDAKKMAARSSSLLGKHDIMRRESGFSTSSSN